VLVLDRDGVVVLANPAAELILEPDLAGKPLSRAVTDAGLRAVIERAARSGETSEVEVETGGRALAVYVRPLATEGGGAVTVVRDMTRLRRLLLVRRDFVANMSHELRTPVTAIQGYSETLLQGTRNPDMQRQFLEIIYRHARRIGALVDGLLALSELEARPPEQAVRAAVEVSSAASHMQATLRDRALQLGASIEVDVAPDVVVRGDPVGLEQVLENLVDNAMKYAKERAHVRVSGARRDGRVLIEVHDDGPGIPAEHLPRLFERFYRVDAGRTRERGGTGLGLAIVKHLVESMGGTIDVRSEAGAGTTFRVDLPAWQDLPSERPVTAV